MRYNKAALIWSRVSDLGLVGLGIPFSFLYYIWEFRRKP